MNSTTAPDLAKRIRAASSGFTVLLERAGIPLRSDSKFDNRHTWDNRGNKGRKVFDNRRTWDNWDNRNAKNKPKKK